MAAGLLDELSPNEETTLFRIANIGDCVHDLRGTSVTPLIALAFVEKHGTCLALTDLGRERLGHSPAGEALPKARDIVAVLVGYGHVSGLLMRHDWTLAPMLCADWFANKISHLEVRVYPCAAAMDTWRAAAVVV